METSILKSVKNTLCIDADYDIFDEELILHINSTLSVLNQLGVGPSNGFAIQGDEQTWAQFLGSDLPFLSMVKSYIYLKARLQFDPPATSFAIDSIKQQASEYEWRLQVAKEDING